MCFNDLSRWNKIARWNSIEIVRKTLENERHVLENRIDLPLILT